MKIIIDIKEDKDKNLKIETNLKNDNFDSKTILIFAIILSEKINKLIEIMKEGNYE